MPEQSSFSAVAAELLSTIETTLPRLREIHETDAGQPRAPGKWSRKQILGHLVDSASNNHQRFVRAQEVSALELPGYAQDHWVAAQRYNDRGWGELIVFWEAYNRHLAHVIGHVPEDRAQLQCTIGGNAPVPLAAIAQGYVTHLRHHLTQIGVWE